MLAALECIALISWICCTDTLRSDTIASSRNVKRKSEFSMHLRYCVYVPCFAHALLCVRTVYSVESRRNPNSTTLEPGRPQQAVPKPVLSPSSIVPPSSSHRAFDSEGQKFGAPVKKSLYHFYLFFKLPNSELASPCKCVTRCVLQLTHRDTILALGEDRLSQGSIEEFYYDISSVHFTPKSNFNATNYVSLFFL